MVYKRATVLECREKALASAYEGCILRSPFGVPPNPKYVLGNKGDLPHESATPVVDHCACARCWLCSVLFANKADNSERTRPATEAATTAVPNRVATLSL